VTRVRLHWRFFALFALGQLYVYWRDEYPYLKKAGGYSYFDLAVLVLLLASTSLVATILYGFLAKTLAPIVQHLRGNSKPTSP